MASLCLGQASLCTLHALLYLLRGAANFLVGFLKQFGQRKLHMRGDATHLLGTFLANFGQKSIECLCVQPCLMASIVGNDDVFVFAVPGHKVAQERRLNNAMFAMLRRLHREEPLMDDMAQAVNRAPPVNINLAGALCGSE